MRVEETLGKQQTTPSPTRMWSAAECCGLLRRGGRDYNPHTQTSRNEATVAEGPSDAGDTPVPEWDRGQRLDSWKEIAGYLKRHVTTVQRWERQEGLPVHRLVHDKLGSVHAYTVELDVWWRERTKRVELEEAATQAPSLAPDPAHSVDRDLVLAASRSVLHRLTSRSRSTGFALAAFVLAATVVGLLIARGSSRDRLDVPSARIQSVAILPLANLSREPDQQYFVDGMTEALITELAKIQSLTVISRTSVMRYKDNTKPLREIARELNVEGVVQGAVVRSGRRVRITAQFVDARSDRHLWAETYERDLNDVLALQGDIARAVAGAVQVTLTPQEQRHLPSTRSVDVEAYDAYLMGRYFWNKRTADGFQKAVAFFQTAIAKDPRYAAAYAGLADCYLVGGREEQPKEVLQMARAAALKALEIDPDLAEARSALAGVRLRYDFDWRGAEEEQQRALALDPNYAPAHLRYSQYLSFRERFAEALREARRAEQLDPFSVMVRKNTAFVLYWARQYDEALQHYRKVLEMEPTFPQALREIGLVYEQKGMFSQSIAVLRKSVGLPGNYFTPMSIADLGHVYASSGSEREARTMLSELHERSRKHYVSAFDIAVIHAGLRDKAQALAWLDKAYDDRSFFLVSLNVDPRFDLLRAEPRFRALVQRVGLPAKPVQGS
jgi:TolB-like protein/Tfp pilus assembly protein PilF